MEQIFSKINHKNYYNDFKYIMSGCILTHDNTLSNTIIIYLMCISVIFLLVSEYYYDINNKKFYSYNKIICNITNITGNIMYIYLFFIIMLIIIFLLFVTIKKIKT